MLRLLARAVGAFIDAMAVAMRNGACPVCNRLEIRQWVWNIAKRDGSITLDVETRDVARR